MTGFWLVLVVVLGGAGILLAMPGGRYSSGRAALVVLLGAGASLVALGLQHWAGATERHWAAIFAGIGLWGAVRVVTHKHPVYSALYFILVVIAVAGMLVLMNAYFLSAALVIIYAGAILVTYVFVIMLASQSAGPASYDRQAREPLIGAVSGMLLLAVVAGRLTSTSSSGGVTVATTPEAVGTVAQAGTHLLTYYAVAVEVAGVLLLAAMVGAIAISRRRALQEAA